MSGEAFSASGPLGLAFDLCSEDDAQAALVGFFLGDEARRASTLSDADRRGEALTCMARFFGDEALDATDYVDYDWGHDTWAGGCYVGLLKPQAGHHLHTTLVEPCGRIHWAGAETASQWRGYIDGAIEAGERAAAEVVAARARR
jgi:monoamine oxidase